MHVLNPGRCTIVIDTVFFKFEYPCETRLPGSMGDPILRYLLLSYQKKDWWILLLVLVYDLSSQNLNFVAPMPERIGTLTMHLGDDN